MREKGAVCNHQSWLCRGKLSSEKSNDVCCPSVMRHVVDRRLWERVRHREELRIGRAGSTEVAKVATPTPLVTAGGKNDVDTIYEVSLPEAGIRCDALVETSPSVLSLGSRVMEEGVHSGRRPGVCTCCYRPMVKRAH